MPSRWCWHKSFVACGRLAHLKFNDALAFYWSNLTNKHARRFINNRNWRKKSRKKKPCQCWAKNNLCRVWANHPFATLVKKLPCLGTRGWKTLRFRLKVGLETRVSPSVQVFSRFMENGSRRSFKAKHLQGFFHAFPYELLFGSHIFPTFLPKLTSTSRSQVKPFLNWTKKRNKHRGPETFYAFDSWNPAEISSSLNFNAEEQCTESHFERKTEDHFGQLST